MSTGLLLSPFLASGGDGGLPSLQAGLVVRCPLHDLGNLAPDCLVGLLPSLELVIDKGKKAFAALFEAVEYQELRQFVKVEV